MVNEQIFSVEVNRSFDLLNKTWKSQVYLKLYINIFRSGLVAALGTEKTMTLLAIASYMNERGECYPTQEQIARDLGVSRKTANKYINELVDFRWNDQALVYREKVRVHGMPHENSIYRIMPISQVAIFNGMVESTGKDDTHTMGTTGYFNKTLCGDSYVSLSNNMDGQALPVLKTGKVIISYFCGKYREKYSVNYSVSWKRDVVLAKKLLADFTPDQVKNIIDITFDVYEEKWANESFPRPTLGQLSTWIPNKALALVGYQEKQNAEFERAVKEGKRYNVEEVRARLARLREGSI
jgi:hypothetical protein